MKAEVPKHLLMLHGWGFPAAVFKALRRQLAEDFIVRMPDRPGYGASLDQYSQQQTTDHKPFKLTSPTMVLGWSLGALSALQLAAEQAGMVTGLVLLAATPCFVNRQDWKRGMEKTVFDAFRQQVEENPAAAMQQFVRLNSAARPERQTQLMLNSLAGSAAYAALLDGLNELERLDLRDLIKKISAPVLLLHATDDRVVPVAASHWLRQHLPGSGIQEYPTGGHAFFLQHADTLTGQIRDFANECS